MLIVVIDVRLIAINNRNRVIAQPYPAVLCKLPGHVVACSTIKSYLLRTPKFLMLS